jgi:hypothetical protein
MPAKSYPLPEWLPDLSGNVLTRAVNVRAIENGYVPVKAPQAVTTALNYPITGGAAFVDSTGASTLFATTAFGWWYYTGSAWTGTLDITSNQQNRFCQFGDVVMIASGENPVRAFDLLVPGSVVPTDAPTLIDVAGVRDFVMGITTDNAVQWSQFNNAMVWSTGVNQADKQPILSGKGVRLIGGEYGILIKDNGVVRITYVGVEGGLDIIFQFDEISAEVGCMASGSVCNVGRLIFFLSERGFMMCDGQEVTPIADEKFNRWFFDTYSRAEIANIWAAIDPRNSCVLWAMPGTPGKIICYNWVLKKATTFELDVQGLFTGYTSGTNLDALGNIDALTVSLDDPSLQGGNPILLVADSTNKLNALTGDNLEATFRLENIEPTPGRRSRVREIRLITDSNDATATLDARMRVGDAENVRAASSMRSNGKLPIRANGRYNTLEVTIPASTDWTFIQGCELEFEAGDAR